MTKTMVKIFSFGLLVLGLMTCYAEKSYAQQLSGSNSNSATGGSDSNASWWEEAKGSFNAGTNMGVSQAQATWHNVVNYAKEKAVIDSETEATVAIGAMGVKNSTVGLGNMAQGVFTGDREQLEEGWQQYKQGLNQKAYADLTNGGPISKQNILNADLPIVGSVTGHLGDRAVAETIKNGGDDMARVVAAGGGISQENLSKVTAADSGWMSRNAITYTLDDGSKVHMDANLNATSGMIEGCMPIPVKLDQLKNCIFCPLFLVLYNTSEAMATVSYEQLAGGFKVLLLIGFALYIAFITLKQVSAFTKQDAPKYITEALTMTFKVLLAWLILSHGSELYRLVLQPLLAAGIEFGSVFLTHQNAGGTVTVDVSSCAKGISGSSGAVFYSRDLYEMIDCFLKKVTQEIAVSQSIGSSLMCVARHKASGLIMWDLTMMFTGLIMWLFAWLICLAFAFYLIDTVIRLGIIGAILPFLIAAWPFKITSGYTKKGWDMFLNAFFTFVFLGLVVSINVELSAQAATGGEGGVQKIMELVNGSNVEALLDVMSIGLSGLIFMILCCVFGFKLCSEAASLASELGAGSGGSIGSKIGSMAAGAAKGVGSRALSGAKNVAVLAGDILPGVDGDPTLNKSIHRGVEGVQKGVKNAIGAGLAKIGLNRFSASASGRLENKGMAQNSGAGRPGSDNQEDNESQDDITRQQNQSFGTQGDTNTNEQGGNVENRDHLHDDEAATVVGGNNSQNEESRGGNGENETSGAEEAAIADAEAAEVRTESDAGDIVSTAKADLAAEAEQIAAQASESALDRLTSGVNPESGDKRGGDGHSGEEANRLREENETAQQNIQQMKARVDELEQKLSRTGRNGTPENNADWDELQKLREKLNKIGQSSGQ